MMNQVQFPAVGRQLSFASEEDASVESLWQSVESNEAYDSESDNGEDRHNTHDENCESESGERDGGVGYEEGEDESVMTSMDDVDMENEEEEEEDEYGDEIVSSTCFSSLPSPRHETNHHTNKQKKKSTTDKRRRRVDKSGKASGGSSTSTVQQLFALCLMANDRGITKLRHLLNDSVYSDSIDTLRDKTRNNCTLLHLAAKRNNVEIMSYLIFNCGANVNASDWCDSRPLHYAVTANAREATILLLSNGAQSNIRDQYDSSPLQIALLNNNIDLANDLIAWGANINMRCKRGDTILHQACKQGYLRRVRYLIEDCNASTTILNANNEHILFSAMAYPSVLQYLCERVQSCHKFLNLVSHANAYGKTVFHIAAERGHLEGLLVIVQHLKLWWHEEQALIEQFICQRLNEYDRDKGCTPLHLSVLFGREDMTKFLCMSAQVDVNRKCLSRGCTPIQVAIYKGVVPICEILIERGKVGVTKHEMMAFQQLGFSPRIEPVHKTNSFNNKLSTITRRASSLIHNFS